MKSVLTAVALVTALAATPAFAGGALGGVVNKNVAKPSAGGGGSSRVLGGLQTQRLASGNCGKMCARQ